MRKNRHMGYENHLQSNLVPVKIRAIQGHLKAALDKAGGFFANAVQVYCAPNVRCERKAAFAGVPICLMSEVYRTMRSHWKGIVKHGLLPGGPISFLNASACSPVMASSSGRSGASWSWNRGHYGARREWSWCREAWCYRDEAGGRWILWMMLFARCGVVLCLPLHCDVAFQA